MKKLLKDKLRTGAVYALLSTVLVAVVLLTYLLRSASTAFMDAGGWVYYVASCLSHGALFAALPFLLLYLPAALMGASRRVCGWLMVAGEAVVVTAFVVNAFVYNLYHFHINGLVIDLLTGPGAGEIFVFSPWLYAKMGLYLMGIVAVCGTLWWLACRIGGGRRLWRSGLLAILCATLLAQGMHIYAAATLKRSVLESTAYLPYYFPLRMNSTFEKWGWIDGDELSLTQFSSEGASVAYPQHPLEVVQPDSLLNIVIIGIDSWNYRTMTPECTPNIWRFAQESENYTQHISSSNGTRGGIFGLFTGVTSYYWDSFEYANLQPLLVTELLRQGYEVQAYPSATLTGPPFAKMLFADVKNLNVTTEGKTVYDRDCQLTRNFISDLNRHFITDNSKLKTQKKQPFFSFLFYDLPHAIELSKDKLYHFQPSWEYADYTKLNNDMDPTPFFNLYRNCVWTVDSLAGLAIDALRQKDPGLKHTVVMITGDHGQEFNENHKNYWGHWANYSRPQTGVPMIYYYPGCEAGDRNYRTTHYDVSTTLLKQVLGVQNPPEDLSMGRMLQDSTSRDWHVVGNDLFYAFILNDGTIIEKRGAGNVVVFDRQMNQLDDYPLNAKQLNDAIIRLNRFYK
jgi:hypothetical protein